MAHPKIAHQLHEHIGNVGDRPLSIFMYILYSTFPKHTVRYARVFGAFVDPQFAAVAMSLSTSNHRYSTRQLHSVPSQSRPMPSNILQQTTCCNPSLPVYASCVAQGQSGIHPENGRVIARLCVGVKPRSKRHHKH